MVMIMVVIAVANWIGRIIISIDALMLKHVNRIAQLVIMIIQLMVQYGHVTVL